MIKIGDFSKLSYISIRMLRYYDQKGVLKPSHVDEISGYRFYDVKQLDIANIVNKLKGLGFSIKNIKEIIENSSEENLNYHFNLRIKEVQSELDNIHRVALEINNMMKDDYNRFAYNVVRKIIPARNVISLRRTIKDYNSEGSLWNDMFKYINKHHIKIVNDNYCLAIFHDKEFKSHDTDIEIQVSVEKLYESSESIKFFVTPELEVATITFTGSYDKMPDVTKSAMYWLDLNNYDLIQPTFNIYHVSPSQDTNPANWITESCFIIKKKEGKNYGTSNN